LAVSVKYKHWNCLITDEARTADKRRHGRARRKTKGCFARALHV